MRLWLALPGVVWPLAVDLAVWEVYPRTSPPLGIFALLVLSYPRLLFL